MDYVENTYEAVKEWLENLDDHELMNVHREYCENANYMDDMISYNDEEFFETYFSNTMDAVRAASYGEYAFTDKFVKFNGLANLESSDNVENLLDISELASYVLDNPDEFKDYVELEDKIRELEFELLDLWIEYFEGSDEEDERAEDTFEDIDLNLEGFRERHLEQILDYEKRKENE